MSSACAPILMGVASPVSEILLLSKTTKFPFQTMGISLSIHGGQKMELIRIAQKICASRDRWESSYDTTLWITSIWSIDHIWSMIILSKTKCKSKMQMQIYALQNANIKAKWSSICNSCMHVYIYIKKFMKIVCSARHTQYMYFIRLIMWELILHFNIVTCYAMSFLEWLMVRHRSTCGIKLMQWLTVPSQHTLIHCKRTLSVKIH